MEKKMIMNYKKRFDEIRHEENGVEFWYARELMHLLDYSKWQNFENVLLKAKVACANNGIVVEDHFADASKMVILGSGANREVEDYMLTRYACYLIAENGDPRKEQIAFAQSYFAVQTRKQELIEEGFLILKELRQEESFENLKNDCLKIYMNVELMMLDLDVSDLRGIRLYLEDSLQNK